MLHTLKNLRWYVEINQNHKSRISWVALASISQFHCRTLSVLYKYARYKHSSSIFLFKERWRQSTSSWLQELGRSQIPSHSLHASLGDCRTFQGWIKVQDYKVELNFCSQICKSVFGSDVSEVEVISGLLLVSQNINLPNLLLIILLKGDEIQQDGGGLRFWRGKRKQHSCKNIKLF